MTAAPETPGIPRPMWLTMWRPSTGLIWYGWYKYSVIISASQSRFASVTYDAHLETAEEELFQYELETEGRVSGCGGFPTLFPFVFGVIIGGPLALVGFPGGDAIWRRRGSGYCSDR